MPRLLFFAALALVACSAADPSDGGPGDGLNVLFVGNSLTYTHNLPRMVAALVPEVGGEPLHVRAIALPNASLEDHWIDGDVAAELATGGWDVVVMQQGPSSLAESRAHLIEWAGRFSDLAREHGARPALLTVWPSEARAFAFDDVVASYAAAADASGADLFPAGGAWQAAIAARTADPYGPDRFHPSPAGTYLAALVVAGGLTGESVVGLPRLGVEAGTAAHLQRLADAARGR